MRALHPLVVLSGLTIWIAGAGCADGSRVERDAAGGGGDGGGGRADAGSDASPDASPDAGAPDSGDALPERCSDEHMFFMDEFGREAYCVYVAVEGDDASGEGTPEAPFATIGHGLEVAVARGVATGRVHAVAVSRGTYEERIDVVSGVSIYGGFDAADGWSRAESNVTVVVASEVIEGRLEALVAVDVGAPTVVERLTIRADASAVGEPDVDVYGARVVDCVPTLPEIGGLILRDLIVEAGSGTDGVDGTAGSDGEDGVRGGRGSDGTTSGPNPIAGGDGAVSVCGVVTVEHTRGGGGGAGGGDGAMGCGTFESSATGGLGPPALVSCMGGGAGDSCGCFDGGAGGGMGNVCASGAAASGADAMVSAVRGDVAAGIWAARDGDDGGDGAAGLGGSGGGGGGSGCNAAGWGPTGGGGGGGGSGGCGGRGGLGGHAGGSSFGLFAVGSTFATPGSSFRSASGGGGGDGALGGEGGGGGEGGPGGSGGFAGGVGGAGQGGGAGGAGVPGPGGSSVGALVCSSEVAELELGSVMEGAAGEGGAAGRAGLPVGLDGVATRIFFGCEL